ncbi:alkylhydroperoxidase [Lampropedia cohaerens]|uniref:Alkylhydroperoxidase n=1 Tax=Lampropedia cohaerens TaxID=1610491 RepID=A0A0U1PZR1_9BURK|nr:carboxymuconolactone decarboxylase family protein [Lampropedia cohaerens]KKW67999.1 alkylhydroperoxidase [Lampropedia cohaerens]
MQADTYQTLITDTLGNMKKLGGGIPAVMQNFNALGKSANTPGALDTKTKELIALGIGVAARCDGCIGFHTQALIRLGVTRAEFEEALGVAIYMGGGPSVMYAAKAIAAYEELSTAP